MTTVATVEAPVGRARVAMIVGIAFAILFAANGFVVGGLTVFDSRMLQDLGVGVAALRLRDTVTVVTLGISVSLVGWLLDRHSVRPILAVGLLLMATAFIAYSQVTNIWHVYAIHVLLGLVQATAGVVACVYLVSGWTRAHRGMALGVLIAGSSLGNALVPAINSALLASLPWRQAILFGAVVAFVLLPPVIWLLREPPRADRLASPAQAAIADAPRETKGMLTSRDFVLLAIIAATTVFSVLAVATNLALFAADDAQRASGPLLLFALFGSAVLAQLVAGAATYRIDSGLIHIVALAGMFIGALALSFATPDLAVLAATIFGLGWGANSTMLQVRPTLLFDGPTLGRALALLAVAETLGGGMGPVVAGVVREATGAFTAAFQGVGLLLLLPLVLSFGLRGRAVGRSVRPLGS